MTDQAKAIEALKAEYTRLSVSPTNTGYTAHQVWGAIDRAVSISRASQGSGATEDARRCIADALQPKFGFLLGGMPRAMAEELASVALEALAALSPPATPQAPEDDAEAAFDAYRKTQAHATNLSWAGYLAETPGALNNVFVAGYEAARATPVTVTMDDLERLAEGLMGSVSNDSIPWSQKSLDDAFGAGRIQIAGSEGPK